jgi:RNA polymerase sigma-70 factor (ECF subfamily)
MTAPSRALEPSPDPGPPRTDDARVRAVVSAHYDLAWRLVRRLGVREADSEDAVQRVFLVVARRLHAIESGKEHAFVVSTAMRIASETRRSAARKPLDLLPEVEEADASASPDELVENLRARRLFDAILDDMPEDARSVFILFEVEELTFTEIAAVLSIPRGTVASRLARGRAWFSSELTKRRTTRKDDGR